MSGGGAPKQEISEAEKFQGEQAVARWNERVGDGYLDLEKDAVADSKLDHSDLFEGMASADLSHAEAETYKNSSNSFSNLSEIGRDITEASDSAQVDAKVNATAFKDKKGLAMVKLGSDVALNSSNIATTSARQGASKALSVLNAKNVRRASKAQAAMTALDGAVQGYSMRKGGYRVGDGKILKDTTSGGKTTTTEHGDALSFFAAQGGL